jgi:MATE family multidrug resistance protein
LVQVIANLLNAGLSMTLVFVLGMGVSGVAAASVAAEYFIFASSMYFALQMHIPKIPQSAWFKFKQLKPLLALNSHTFVRNLALQLCIAFLVLQGAKLGPMTAATNAILMQFFTLIALGLDGIAYAVEALVGEAKGKSSQRQITLLTLGGLFYSGVAAMLYSLLFVVTGSGIISLLSNQAPLQAMATEYLPVICLLPLVAHWCFLLDGVFVGLTRAKAMQNSILLSCLVFYTLGWYWLLDYGNWGLWFAMLIFMLVRSLSLGLYFTYLHRKGLLLD